MQRENALSKDWLKVRWSAGAAAEVEGTSEVWVRHGSLVAGWRFDGDRLELRADRYGLLPLYLHRMPDGVLVSTSLAAMVRAGAPATLDDDAIAVLLRKGSLIGDDTPLKAVRRVSPGAVMTFAETGEEQLGGGWPIPEPSSLGFEAAARAYAELFHDALRADADAVGDRVVLLSGGRDSRHILLGLRAVGQPVARTVTVRTETLDHRNNTEIAAQLSSLTSVPHETVPMPAGRWDAERRKNRLTDLAALEHFWMLGAHDWLRGRNAIVYDGLAGDVLSESKYLTQQRVDWFAGENWSAVVADFLGPEAAIRNVLSPLARQRFSRERAEARLVAELRVAARGPNPAQAFRLANRTRRAIAPSSFGILGSVASVRTPYLYPPLHDMLASLDPGVLVDSRLHSTVIARTYPDASGVPYDARHVHPTSRRALLAAAMPALLHRSPRGTRDGSEGVESTPWRVRLIASGLRGAHGSVSGLLMAGAWFESLHELLRQS